MDLSNYELERNASRVVNKFMDAVVSARKLGMSNAAIKDLSESAITGCALLGLTELPDLFKAIPPAPKPPENIAVRDCVLPEAFSHD